MNKEMAQGEVAVQRHFEQQHEHVADEQQLGHHVARQRLPREHFAHIAGWGSDLERKNRPAVPMERTPPRFIHAPVGQPAQQAQKVEVFCSPERPRITPIFGTAQAPKWLSGAIRRFAYTLTENDLRHWLLLIAADRVDMVEGIVDDLRRGHVPNLLGEMGIRSELRHNPAGLVRKTLIATAIVGGMVVLMKSRNRG